MDVQSKLMACKKTNVPLGILTVERLVLTVPYTGVGEIKRVGHLFCPDHGGPPQIAPEEPIMEDDLVDLEVYA